MLVRVADEPGGIAHLAERLRDGDWDAIAVSAAPHRKGTRPGEGRTALDRPGGLILQIPGATRQAKANEPDWYLRNNHPAKH